MNEYTIRTKECPRNLHPEGMYGACVHQRVRRRPIRRQAMGSEGEITHTYTRKDVPPRERQAVAMERIAHTLSVARGEIALNIQHNAGSRLAGIFDR